MYFSSLSLPSASWASRSPTKLEMQGSSKGQIAAVSERSDHQPPCVPQVLIPIDKLCIDCSQQQLILPIVAVEK